jgi:hypothetical protein
MTETTVITSINRLVLVMELVSVHCEVQHKTLSAKKTHFVLAVYLRIIEVSHNKKKRLF